MAAARLHAAYVNMNDFLVNQSQRNIVEREQDRTDCKKLDILVCILEEVCDSFHVLVPTQLLELLRISWLLANVIEAV